MSVEDETREALERLESFPNEVLAMQASNASILLVLKAIEDIYDRLPKSHTNKAT